MSRREIERYLKTKGIVTEHMSYEWHITPSGKFPCWHIILSETDAEKFGETPNNFFDSSEELMQWASELRPYIDDEEPTK